MNKVHAIEYLDMGYNPNKSEWSFEHRIMNQLSWAALTPVLIVAAPVAMLFNFLAKILTN